MNHPENSMIHEVRIFVRQVDGSILLMKTLRMLRIVVYVISVLLLPRAMAVVPTVVDSASGPEIIEGYKLHGSGVMWWKTGISASEADPGVEGVVAIRRVLQGVGFNLSSSRTFFPIRSRELSAPTGGVERVGDNLFYYQRTTSPKPRIHRRSIYAPVENSIDFAGVSYDRAGAMATWGGRLYWTVIQGLDMSLHSKPVDAGPGGGDRIEFSLSNEHIVKKIVVADELLDDGRHFATHLALLTISGNLYIYEVEGQRAGEPPRLLNSNVSDFAVRNEATHEVFEPRVYGTVFYMATGANLSESRTSGKLVVHDLTAGPLSTFVMHDTGNRDSQITSVAVDADRVFMTITPLAPGGGFGATYDRFRSAVWGRLYPADRLIPFGATTPFGTLAIEPFGAPLEAAQLISDRQWLYWIHANQIRKIPTDTPTFSLDYAALDLEAIQAVQDADNSVPLVAGKPTLVRGYAKITANSASLSGLPLKARLRVIRNGNLIGEVYSDNKPLIDANDAPIVLRSELNRSFHFNVPAELIQGGPMQLEMMINPNRTVPETGGAALANNTVTRSFDVVNVATPCLAFVTMDSNNPDYTIQSPGFWSIIDRTLSLFPVPGFQVRSIAGVLSKPTFGRTEPYTMPDDKNWAMIWLTMFHAFRRPLDGCTYTHWVGMFPPEDRPWNGIGGTRNVSASDLLGPLPFNISIPNTPLVNTLCVRMEPGQGNSSSPWSSIQGGHTIAHELGHNYGRFHIDQTLSLGCGINKPDRPWHVFPGNPCTLGKILLSNSDAPIGYDRISESLVLPNMAGDLMTYANSSWISPFTWNALLSVAPKLPNPPAPPPTPGAAPAPSAEPDPVPPQNIFFVQGSLRPWDRTAFLFPAFALPIDATDPATIQALLNATDRVQANSPYRLRLIGNPAAAPLADRPILFLPTTERDGAELAFAQPLDAMAGVTRIQVVQEQQVLAEWLRTANAPALTLNSPLIDPTAESLSMTWSATDSDGDALLFAVQFTHDNGTTWQTLQVNSPALGIAISTTSLRGGNQCRLRVIATDGLNTTLTTSDQFTLPKRAPVISYTGISDQQQVAFGSNPLIRFFAYDAEDGMINQLSWTVAGRETRGEANNTVSLAHLAPGTYTIGMFANDSDGNIGSAAVQIEILPLTVTDGVVNLLDGLDNDPGYATAQHVPFRQSPNTEAKLVHQNGYLYVSVSGLRVSDNDAIPSSLQILLDRDYSGGSAPQAGDIGFIVDESGFLTQLRGNGSGMVSDSSPSPDLRLEIILSESTWNLELAIPDSLLGGWNHSAGLMFWYQRYWWVAPPGISAPDSPLAWPIGNPNQPSTWAEIHFGPLITVSNHPPSAVIVAPAVVSVSSPQTVQLDGSRSHDPDNNPLTYSWVQTAGPSVVLSNPSVASPTFTTPNVASQTTLRFQLTVNDGQLNSSPASVAVTVIPLPNPPANSPTVSLNKTNGSATSRLRWGGAPGDRAVIQASTDLVQWIDLATNTVGFLESILYTDLQAGLFPYRFYRARLLPPTSVPSIAQLRFDGQDDYVEIPHTAELNTLPLTITAWIRTTQTTGSFPGIVTKVDGTLGVGYGIALDQGRLACFYILNLNSYLFAGGSDGMPFVADGYWHHVAYVATTTEARIYLDGSLVKAHPWTGSPGPNSNPDSLKFGVFFGGNGKFYQGDLDEVALWNRALTDVEVNGLLPGTLTGSEPGLLGYWNLDAGTGAIAPDISGHGHNGALQGSPLWLDSTAPLQANPAAATALRFDGVDDSVQVAHHAALNPFPMTVAGWIKTAQNSPGYVAVANKYPAGSGNGYSLHIHNGSLAAFYFRGDGASYIYAADPGIDGGFIADGRWHHVAFIVDASGGWIFVDGVQTGSLGWTGTPGACTTAAQLQFGRYPIGGPALSLDGRIDELTLWNRALDAPELNALMNSKQTGSEPGLVGFWSFDNGTGTTATDATGHGHSGTLQLGPMWIPSDVPVYP